MAARQETSHPAPNDALGVVHRVPRPEQAVPLHVVQRALAELVYRLFLTDEASCKGDANHP